jgi:pyruvate/2-oxoglutarate/acetoin dehydrogenase E1 component
MPVPGGSAVSCGRKDITAVPDLLAPQTMGSDAVSVEVVEPRSLKPLDVAAF